MQTDYWKSTEVQPSFSKWLGFYEGRLRCACDHGCNQWVREQGFRAVLLFRILSTPGATTKLDKATQIPLERANKIWFRIADWECDRFNRELRKQEAADARILAHSIGTHNIEQALKSANGDRRKAEEMLGLPKYGLSAIMAYVLNKEEDDAT